MRGGWTLLIATVLLLASTVRAQITGCAEPYVCDAQPGYNESFILENERAACAANALCAELYGQADGPNQPFFDATRNTVAPTVPIEPDYAIRELICGMTWDEASALATAALLVNQYGQNNPCGAGERLIPATPSDPADCVPRDDQVNTNGEWQDGLLFGVLVSVLVLILLVMISVIVQRLHTRPRKTTKIT